MTTTYKKLSGLIAQFTLAILFCTSILSSCTSNYYLASSPEETAIYSEENLNTAPLIIPANKTFIYWGSRSRPKTKYGMMQGYSIYSVSWTKLAKLQKNQIEDLTFKDGNGYTYSQIANSLYGGGKKTSTSKSSGGPVQVKGYTRKDGTYVKPHTRSAPRRH